MFSTCCYFCWFSDPPWHPAGAEWDENGAKNWSFGLFFDTISTHAAKKKHNPQHHELFFRNLGPKTRFPFTLWPTTTWNPQPTTHPFWMDLLLFWDNILDRCLRMLFLYSTQGSDKICQDLQRSAKICQDQTRSTKGSASTNLQAPLAETNHETPSSKNEGAAVSRRMASSIRSGPGGARGVLTVQMCSFPYVFCLKKASLVFSLKKGCLIVFFTCIFIQSNIA